VTAVDSSVTVPAFASWHEHHGVARAALAQRPRLIGHVALETYSVLTRLPPPLRIAPEPVLAFLERNFPEPAITLPARWFARLLRTLREQQLAGGAVYDALIAVTAQHAGHELLTLDRRALPTYEALGAPVRMLA
jgi:predicted nucleic acid-binding protein